eukprot:9497747-Pyramimonas_sp.AAC.1
MSDTVATHGRQISTLQTSIEDQGEDVRSTRALLERMAQGMGMAVPPAAPRTPRRPPTSGAVGTPSPSGLPSPTPPAAGAGAMGGDHGSPCGSPARDGALGVPCFDQQVDAATH